MYMGNRHWRSIFVDTNFGKLARVLCFLMGWELIMVPG